MELFKGLPLFNCDIVEGMEGVDIISLVTDPAVQVSFLKFSNNKEIKMRIEDEEKHIVSGVALIPNQKIYRRDDDGREYYIQFSKEAVERIALNFFKGNNTTNVNLEHSAFVDGCTYFESYLINKERGVAPKEFEDMPDGTWIVSCKIENPEVWELVRNGTLTGFSVEGTLQVSQSKPMDSLKEFFDFLQSTER